jgi:hypothetical protein
MRRETPDSRFYTELEELNLEFLQLLADRPRHLETQAFGLEAGVVEQISRLTLPQRQAVAATPCLLAGLGRWPQRGNAVRIAEDRTEVGDRRWADAARVFVTGLVTYVWQMARRDDLHAALCLGGRAREFRDFGFREAQRYAAAALGCMEARFRYQRWLWPDLIRCAREGNAERLRLAQLSAVQLALSEAAAGRCRPPPAVLYCRPEIGATG